jgi:Glycosyltransferases involved in cell wall biogenesis
VSYNRVTALAGTTQHARGIIIEKPMLYICIPAYNESPTIGLLLWRIRKVFEEHPREYEIVVLDDGSTDATAETLKSYADSLPLTVLHHETRRGYAAALDTLSRTVAKGTRYPRRDAMVIMQADFTDQPEHIPELVKLFEGGADMVVAERPAGNDGAPAAVRRLRRVAPWLVRPMVKVPGVHDSLGTFRLYRIAVMRDVIRASESVPIVQWSGWAANAELLVKAAPFCRRIETVPLGARYDLRPRATRVRPFEGAMDLYRFGWTKRARRLTTDSA